MEDILSHLLFNDLDDMLEPIEDKECLLTSHYYQKLKIQVEIIFDELISFLPMVIDGDNYIEIKTMMKYQRNGGINA